MEDALKDVRRNEEEICQSNQSLLSRLEEVQVRIAGAAHKLQHKSFPASLFVVVAADSPQGKLAKLSHEHRELKEKLREERKQAEELWKSKTQLEDERRLQDRTVEQMQRKVSHGNFHNLTAVT